MMLHTKYQGYRLCGNRKEDFLSFHLENLFSTLTTTTRLLLCNSSVYILPYSKLVFIYFIHKNVNSVLFNKDSCLLSTHIS